LISIVVLSLVLSEMFNKSCRPLLAQSGHLYSQN